MGESTAIIVFGVSGAGKTVVGRLLAESLGWQFFDADDFHPAANIEKLRAGIALNDSDRQPWLDRLRDLLVQRNAAGENTVLACSALKATYRAHLRINRAVKFVYLGAGYPLIEERLRQRHDHFMNPTLLRSQFADLEEPGKNENALTVDASSSPRKIVAEIKSNLLLVRQGSSSGSPGQ